MSRLPQGPTHRQASGAAVQRHTSGAPGKRTLTSGFVQRRAAGTPGTTEVHQAAARGVDTPTAAMPHAETIQSAFGAEHDISGIQAHVGGDTAEACADMGATAFASGNHVAFAESPSLHTAAHEAAHVVQQAQGVNLEGGVGEAGDAFESHADAVADAVVAGQPVSELLASGPGGNRSEGVQRKIARPTVVQREGDGTAPGAAPVAGEAAVAGAAGAIVGAAGGAAKVAKLHLFVDVDVADLGVSDLKAGNVGHTWIAIEYIDPAAVPDSVHASHKPLLKTGGKYSDPMGFWPDTENGIYYSTNIFASYVQGKMRHPDTAHQGMEKGSQSWDLTQAEVDAVITYAESKRGAQYSVYFFNCTDFGVQAVAAAGKSAPAASSARICYPNALYAGIKANQQKGVGNTMTKDVDGSNEVTTAGADAERKR